MNSRGDASDSSRVFRLSACLALLALVLASSPVVAAAPQEQAAALKAPQQVAEPQKPARTPAEEAMMRGDVMMIRRQYSDAIRAYNDLLRLQPKNSGALNKIGMAYYHLNDLEMAKRYYERSLKVNNAVPEVHNNLGVVFYRRKKYSRAIKDYERSLKLYATGEERHSGVAAVYSNMGYAYFGAKKYEEAMANFQQAMALDPVVFERRSASGGTLLQERSVEERAFFLFFVAKSYALAKNAERAAHYLKRAYEEGYASIPAIARDPAFSGVIDDPQVKDILLLAQTTPPPKRT